MSADKGFTSITETDLNGPRPDSKGGRSVNAPEVDTSVLAPQHYALPEGLQIELSKAPEFFRDALSTLPHPDDDYPKEWVNDTVNTVTQSRRPWRRLRIPLFLAIIIVIALGVGLGVEIPAHQSASNSSSSRAQPTHGALNDTSLAATADLNGNRHLFFQDINGTIRHAIFSHSLDAWSDTIEFIPAERQPKLYTPIAVAWLAVLPPAPYIAIFYVDINNNLAATEYSVAAERYVSPSVLLNNSFAVSPDSQSLSISRLHWTENATDQSSQNNQTQVWQEWQEYLLAYSSPSDNVTFLYGINRVTNVTGNVVSTWEWQNVSQPFYAQSNPNGWLSEPFFTSLLSNGTFFGHFFNPQFKSDSNTYPFLTLNINNLSSTANGSEVPNSVYFPGATLPGGEANETYGWTVMIPDASNMTGPLDALIDGTSGVADYSGDICVVDNQTLYISTHAMPDMAFPFGRLASAYGNGSTTYIYHQFNESMLLEETGDEMLSVGGFGKPKQIVIPT